MFRQAKTTRDIIINWVTLLTVVVPIIAISALGALFVMCHLIMSVFQTL